MITCHDVLAIRGAMGFQDAYCPATKTGKVLQRWILHYLSNAHLLVADSALTLNQLAELCKQKFDQSRIRQVIHIAFNANFSPTKNENATALLARNGVDISKPYILHVGSGLVRKNRQMLLEMVSVLGHQWSGNIYFAGEDIDHLLEKRGIELGIKERMFAVVKPNHELLQALYSNCQAFIFPSFSEGFGWPLIEAQACGVPVIASNIEPMPEISGGTALHADPNNPHEFAEAFKKLSDFNLRENLIINGMNNCKRFGVNEMIQKYVSLIHLV